MNNHPPHHHDSNLQIAEGAYTAVTTSVADDGTMPHHEVVPDLVIPVNQFGGLECVIDPDKAEAEQILSKGRGYRPHFVHIDESGYVPNEAGLLITQDGEVDCMAPTTIVDQSDAGVSDEAQSIGSIQVADHSVAASDGSVGESNAVPREVYHPHTGNYPFPQAFRKGKDAKGNWKVERTIPLQPVNYQFDRRRFTMDEIKKVAKEKGIILNRARFSQFLRMQIPRMVRT